MMAAMQLGFAWFQKFQGKFFNSGTPAVRVGLTRPQSSFHSKNHLLILLFYLWSKAHEEIIM